MNEDMDYFNLVEEIKNLKLCSYDVSMKLKRLGFNEPCDYLYTTAIRHNGEDLGSDEEYELRAEGHGDEIEYTPGGWLENHYNCNYFDYLSDDNCSAPFLHDVVDWFEKKHNLIINPEPFVSVEFNDDKEITNVMAWHCIVYHSDGSKPSYIMEARQNRYEAIADGIEEALKLIS